MSEMIYKVLEDCEVKKLGERQYEFIASTSDIDRDGEVIDVKGWDFKNFRKNPVVTYAHDYRALPVGRVPKIWITRDGKVKNTIEFPPPETYDFADTVERLVDTGYLRTVSVGFIPKEWTDGDGTDKSPRKTYTKQELLEIAIVPVPSNPDALRNAVTDGVITTKELDTITKPEEDDDYIRIPVAECKVTATIDISKKEGIKALYCGKEKQVRTYLFDKREPYNWTMAKAKKWVEDHKGVDEAEGVTAEEVEVKEKPPQEREMSQAGIMDELDYLIKLLKTEGMNDEAEEDAWNLVREVMRLAGDDIPDDILVKIGAVLSSKNKGNLKQAQTLIQTVLDSAESEQESEQESIDDKEEPEMEEAQIFELIQKTVRDVIEKAQGKID